MELELEDMSWTDLSIHLLCDYMSLKQIISALCLNFSICNKEVILAPSFISVLCVFAVSVDSSA